MQLKGMHPALAAAAVCSVGREPPRQQQGTPRGRRWCGQDRERAVLVSLLLLALGLVPLLWTSNRAQHATLYSRRAFLSRFTVNIHGQPIFAEPQRSRLLAKSTSARRAKAAIVVLARNEDCDGVLHSIARMEARFNAKFGYPYVFLNNAPFTADFVNRTSAATGARTQYGEIPVDQWSVPAWVPPEEAAAAQADMAKRGVLYGGHASYHLMCRYFSGFLAWHPLLLGLDMYWRMEPDVHYYCDLDYDPFAFMQERGLKYGFVITVHELANTIPTLWNTTQRFLAVHQDIVPEANLMPFVSGADGGYNLCHFWSNFEIGDLRFFRSEAYMRYFDYLDRTGGFFYERWGDAPVHSLGAAIFLNSSEVHFFQDIGYRHNSMKHCPAVHRNKCDCDAMEAVSFHAPSFGRCHQLWEEFVAGDRHGAARQQPTQAFRSRRIDEQLKAGSAIARARLAATG